MRLGEEDRHRGSVRLVGEEEEGRVTGDDGEDLNEDTTCLSQMLPVSRGRRDCFRRSRGDIVVEDMRRPPLEQQLVIYQPPISPTPPATATNPTSPVTTVLISIDKHQQRQERPFSLPKKPPPQ